MRFAAAFGVDPRRCSRIVERMRAAQALPRASFSVVTTTAGAIGVSSRPNASGDLERFVVTAPTGGVLIIAGTPISTGGPLAAALAAIAAAQPEGAVRRAAPIEGAFVAIHWHPAPNSVGLVTDFLSRAPVFESVTTGRVRLLASSERAILASGFVDPCLTRPAGARFSGSASRCHTPRSSRVFGHAGGRRGRDRRISRGLSGRLRAIVAAVQRRLRLPRDRQSRVGVGRATAGAGAVASGRSRRCRLPVRGRGSAATWLSAHIHRVERNLFNSADYRRYVALGDLAVPSLGLFICTTPRLLHSHQSGVWADSWWGRR